MQPGPGCASCPRPSCARRRLWTPLNHAGWRTPTGRRPFLESLVPSSHSAVLTHALAGVTARWDKTCVGGEPVGAREGADLAHGHQELSSEDQPHAWQASENPSLRTGEKTLPDLLVDVLNVRFFRARISPASSATIREATSSCAGRVTLFWALAALRALCAMYVCGSFNAAGPQVSGDALVARSSKVWRSLVVGEEGEGSFAVHIQRSLQSRKQRQECLSLRGAMILLWSVMRSRRRARRRRRRRSCN